MHCSFFHKINWPKTTFWFQNFITNLITKIFNLNHENMVLYGTCTYIVHTFIIILISMGVGGERGFNWPLWSLYSSLGLSESFGAFEILVHLTLSLNSNMCWGVWSGNGAPSSTSKKIENCNSRKNQFNVLVISYKALFSSTNPNLKKNCQPECNWQSLKICYAKIFINNVLMYVHYTCMYTTMSSMYYTCTYSSFHANQFMSLSNELNFKNGLI